MTKKCSYINSKRGFTVRHEYNGMRCLGPKEVGLNIGLS